MSVRFDPSREELLVGCVSSYFQILRSYQSAGCTIAGDLNAMRAHSSPMRAYLLDAMIYCMIYARFAVACAESTLSSSLEGAEKEVQARRVGECRCLLQWSQGSRDTMKRARTSSSSISKFGETTIGDRASISLHFVDTCTCSKKERAILWILSTNSIVA